jgi:hypothetical protein
MLNQNKEYGVIYIKICHKDGTMNLMNLVYLKYKKATQFEWLF